MKSVMLAVRERLGRLVKRIWGSREQPGDPSAVDRDARTLHHWRYQFAGAERTIECSAMRLIGGDHEGDIFTGPGRIRIDDRGIRFYLHGTAADAPAAFRKFLAARASPHDALEQFRLIATDYRGTTWTGGFTSVDFFVDHDRGWPLTGELQGLSTRVDDFGVARTAGVEMLLVPPVDLPMDEAMETSTRIGGENVFWSRGSGRQQLKALGSRISFELDPSEKALWITATMSSALQPVFAERWLTEPLRIMLGALIYPRLIARNFGDGSATVTFLPAPLERKPSIFGLMQPFVADGYAGRNREFWQLYADILTMIGNSRSDDGHPSLDYHEVTRLYEELIQSLNSSRWVISMTLASTIEALAKSLMTEADRRTEYPPGTLDGMRRHLRAWKGDDRLRARMLDSVAFAGNRSVLGFMNGLARRGRLDQGQVDTWRWLRNSVMHGELTEPWSTAEGDGHVRDLIGLAHALTRLRIADG